MVLFIIILSARFEKLFDHGVRIFESPLHEMFSHLGVGGAQLGHGIETEKGQNTLCRSQLHWEQSDFKALKSWTPSIFSPRNESKSKSLMSMVNNSGLYNWTGVCVGMVVFPWVFVNLVQLEAESREVVKTFSAESHRRWGGDY